MALFPQILSFGFQGELRITGLCFHPNEQASSSHFAIIFKPLFVFKPSEQKYISRRQEYLKHIQFVFYRGRKKQSHWCPHCGRSCCISSCACYLLGVGGIMNASHTRQSFYQCYFLARNLALGPRYPGIPTSLH